MSFYGDHLRPRLHNLALSTKATGEIRARVCAELAGDVLEIGYGSGLNQPHLPSAVSGVWAVEPSTTALRLGEARRTASPVPVVVAGDDAQALPFPDGASMTRSARGCSAASRTRVPPLRRCHGS